MDLDFLKEIPGEIIKIKQETKNIPERNTTSNYELIFRADLGPFRTPNSSHKKRYQQKAYTKTTRPFIIYGYNFFKKQPNRVDIRLDW